MVERRSVSTVAVALILAVLVVVAGAGYYLVSTMGGSATESVTISSTITTASSSSLSTSASTSATSSTSVAKGTIILSFGASPPLASTDVNVSYPVRISTLGGVPSTLSLNATSTHGLRIAFSPSTFSTNFGSGMSTISIGVPNSVSPGSYSVNIVATAEGQQYVIAQTIQVLKFLVITPGDSFYPASLTVTAGSMVTWLRLNGEITQYDPGDHNVSFMGGIATSPTLAQYQSWSYTFHTAGEYRYVCTFHPGMQGDIIVTP